MSETNVGQERVEKAEWKGEMNELCMCVCMCVFVDPGGYEWRGIEGG